jgi:peptidoglycan/xylan/chitin deacetylase (PgdA/CDA1 family)
MTIVTFHRVTDELPADDVTCGSAKFKAFCDFFRRYFDVVPLSEQIAGRRSNRNMGGTLSITFDDGYLDNIEVAAPILRELQLPATFFVTTGFIGTRFVPPWDKHLPIQSGWMNWDNVRSLASQGFEIGSHTDSHLNMATEEPGVILADLRRSMSTLERELGVRPQLFAYPFGGREHITTHARGLVREAGFTCCASCWGGLNTADADLYTLNRIGIGEWFAIPHQLGFELVTAET